MSPPFSPHPLARISILLLTILLLLLAGCASVTPPTPAPTPTLPPGDTLYQGYERGFMVAVFDLARVGEASPGGAGWVEENCLYTYLAEARGIFYPRVRVPEYAPYRYCTTLEEIYPDTSIADSEVTPALVETAFADLWALADARAALGDPVGEAVIYEASVPPNLDKNYAPEGPWYLPVIRLPDGATLYCGSRGATVGNCYVE